MPHFRRPTRLLLAVSLAFCTGMSAADDTASSDQQFLSARESDPQKMGWMQGFPPPKDKQVRFADGSFFEFPASRWSVAHMRRFMPTTSVSRGLDAPGSLEYALDQGINDVTFVPWGKSEPMTWEDALWKNYTDGILVMHEGKVVYERYFGALDEAGKHAAMSVTKSLTGTLAAIMVAEGELDEHKRVVDYLPEMKDSGFADATLRQVMDMTTGLRFSEDYADPKAEIWQYSAAGNPLPKPEGYKGPVGYYEYLQTVEKQGVHGEAFGYRTVNADLLGWIIARASGKSVAELLSERIWQRLGMEQSGYYSVDELGTPFAGGGFNAGLRDMARFGQLMLNEGEWRGERLFPASVVEDIRQGGSRDAFAKSGYDALDGWSYRNMWWVTHNEHDAFTARGVFGQTVYVDPTAQMVIVRFASNPVAANSANDPYSLPAYQAVADYLIDQDSRRNDEDQ